MYVSSLTNFPNLHLVSDGVPTISSTKLFSVLGNVDVSCLNTIPPLAALVQRNVLDSLQSSVVVVFPTVSSTKLFSVLGRVSVNVGRSSGESPFLLEPRTKQFPFLVNLWANPTQPRCSLGTSRSTPP